MGITITVDDRPVLDYLEQLLAKVEDLTPVMDSIGLELESRVRARFETRTDPLGRPWADWKESTRKSYPEDGRGKLLDRYGDMWNHVGYQADANSVTVGFAEPYAAYHEFGTKHMERRGLLTADPEAGTLAPDDRESILNIVADYLSSA